MRRDRQAWGIRAQPEHEDRMREFLRDDLVALGWKELGDLRGLDFDGIKEMLRTRYRIRDARELGRQAGALDTFVNRARAGHSALVPSPEDGSVYIAEIAGEYRYVRSKEKDGYPHQRCVRWLMNKSSISRNRLPADVASALRAHQPIFSMPRLDFSSVTSAICASNSAQRHWTAADIDTDLHADEGKRVYVLNAQARRNRKLREKKIHQALSSGDGRLICEVSGCGFDFEATYGVIGRRFAHVHHREPLGSRQGERVSRPADLAIVCANCHAMIHRHGKCRDLDELIPKR